jgi:hypothetical protein
MTGNDRGEQIVTRESSRDVLGAACRTPEAAAHCKVVFNLAFHPLW